MANPKRDFPALERDNFHEVKLLSAAKSSKIDKNTPGKTLEWLDTYISKIQFKIPASNIKTQQPSMARSIQSLNTRSGLWSTRSLVNSHLLIGRFDPWSVHTSIHRRLKLRPKIIKNI